MENKKQDDIIIREWIFKEEQEPFKRKRRKVYNPKTLKQRTRDNIKLDDEVVGKEVAKKRLIHEVLLMKNSK